MDSDQQDLFAGTEFASADEGAFEAQLFLAAAAGQSREPLRTVVKRNGHEEKFDPSKVAAAILEAAHVGDHIDSDTAASLAQGVAIYLGRHITTGPPSAEHVADAVEQVLFGMGHVRTGLAYTRYRDRRGRIRQLKSGDVRAFLGEIEDAKHSASTDDTTPIVRTVDDQVSPWDRARIVDTLIRETQADEATAEAVATAVDEQVRHCGVKAVTAGLIRELVDAKLIEIGREDLRRRHARLGVPLFDAQQLVCAPNADESIANHTPETTEILLARRVKRAYALESVFGGDVAAAHQRGDIHVHGLGTIDRLHAATTMAGLAEFEAGEPGHATSPRHSLDAGRRLGHWHTFLRAFHGHEVCWRGLGAYLASLGSAPPASRQGDAFLRRLMAPGQGTIGPWMALDIEWPLATDVVEDSDEDEPDTTESARVWAQLFAEEAYLCNGEGPSFIFHLSEDVLRDSDAAAYVGSVVDAAMKNPSVSIHLDRGAYESEDTNLYKAVAHKVTLNLCRAAISGGDMDGCLRVLESQFEYAVHAHLEKRAFLDRLVTMGPIGPLSGVIAPYAGDPLMDLEKARWAIGVVGMNECVELLTGDGLHGSAEAQAAAATILDALSEWAATASRQEGMEFVIAQSTESHVRTRLAHSDVRQLGADARRLVKVEGLTQDVTYTAGLQAAAGLSITPMDRLAAESDGQARVPMDGCATVVLPMPDMPLEPVIELLRTALRRTEIERLRFA